VSRSTPPKEPNPRTHPGRFPSGNLRPVPDLSRIIPDATLSGGGRPIPTDRRDRGRLVPRVDEPYPQPAVALELLSPRCRPRIMSVIRSPSDDMYSQIDARAHLEDEGRHRVLGEGKNLGPSWPVPIRTLHRPGTCSRPQGHRRKRRSVLHQAEGHRGPAPVRRQEREVDLEKVEVKPTKPALGDALWPTLQKPPMPDTNHPRSTSTVAAAKDRPRRARSITLVRGRRSESPGP
jgi:hypothetical protein